MRKMLHYLRFRPQFVPTVMTVVMLAGVLGLGFWQLQRLSWKEDLMASINVEVQQKPVTPPQPLTLPESGYRHLLLEGEFLHEKEMPMGGRYYRNTMGYHLLTPFRLTDGRVVLVNRGWVGVLERKADTRPETLITGIQRFAGMAHRPEPKRLFSAENDPKENIWFWYDLAGMRRYTGLNFPDVVIDALESEGMPASPRPAAKHIELRNDHLMYALTWFSFALALLVIYVVYHQPYRDDRGQK